MTGNSDSSVISRRFLLQTLGAAGVASLAGCSGDAGSGQTDTTTTSTENTTTASGPTYSLPESEHKDTVELVRRWGNNFPGTNRLMLDSYSPEQVENKTEVSPIMDETDGTQYQMFDWGPWVIPETIVQSADGTETNARVRADQLPGDVTKQGVIEDLRNDGYVERGQRDGFTIMSNRSRSEARAIGNDYHVLSYEWSEEGAVESSDDEHVQYIREALDAYSTGGAQPGADVMDHTYVLDIKYTFGALVRREENPDINYLPEVDPNQLPVSGASTLDMDEEKIYVSWKFESSDEAQRVQELIASDDYPPFEYTQIEREGEFITAEGPADEEAILHCVTPKPFDYG